MQRDAEEKIRPPSCWQDIEFAELLLQEAKKSKDKKSLCQLWLKKYGDQRPIPSLIKPTKFVHAICGFCPLYEHNLADSEGISRS